MEAPPPRRSTLMPSPYFRITDLSVSSPVILHAPHGGRLIPAEHLGAYLVSAAELEAEKNIMTDHFTDELVGGITGASSVTNELSRFAVDVERFPDETEEMNAVGMGVLYTNGSRGQQIRDLRRADRPRLMGHFEAYSAAFTDLVDATLRRHGRAVIIDVHSYPEHALAYELHAEQPRPELCLGYEDFHAPTDLVRTVTDAFAQLEILPNGPFAGAYVPLEHYGTDARVQSVMLEIRRDVYLHDSLELKSGPFQGLQASLQRLVNSVVGEI
ncbi:N-formylglutamate amidohydrolase [Cryobacterium sp. Hh7]|nr:N-formylglutamate amidohydrolase [Cryobacterium sp. Hh7]